MRQLVKRLALPILAVAVVLLLIADFVGTPAQLVLRVTGSLAMLIAGWTLLKLAQARISGFIAHSNLSRQRDWSKPDSVDSETVMVTEPGNAA